MPLPASPTGNWMQRLGFPSRPFEGGHDDHELYAEDDAFVLRVEVPGFDVDDIEATWDDGILDVAAEREDDRWEGDRTYHRRFRVPREVDEESLTAEYDSGVLEFRLPVSTGTATGTEIDVQG